MKLRKIEKNIDTQHIKGLQMSILRFVTLILSITSILYLSFHKSNQIEIFGRYSVQFFFLLFTIFLLNVTISIVCLNNKYFDRFVRRLQKTACFSLLFIICNLLFLYHLVIDVRILLPLFSIETMFAVIFLCSEKPKQIIRRTALGIIGITFSIFLSEVIFRVFFLTPLVPRNLQELSTTIASSWPHTIEIKKESEKMRIVGLADSFGVAGNSNNYHYILEELLQKQGIETEVVNLSRVGFDLPEYQKMWTRFGFLYKPNLVIHGFFVGNDFELATGDLYIYKNITVRGQEILQQFSLNKSLVITWIKELWKANKHEKEMQNNRKSNIQGTFIEDEFMEIERKRYEYICNKNIPSEILWKKQLVILRNIRKNVEEGGSTYLLLIHPDEFQVEKELEESIVRRFNLNPI